MTAPDAFALGGREDAAIGLHGRVIASGGQQQDDVELVRLERELAGARARFDAAAEYHMSDEETDAGCSECRDLERSINETPPQTMIGAAVKLRQVLWIADDTGDELAEDEKVSLRQVIAFLGGMAGSAASEERRGTRRNHPSVDLGAGR